MNDDDDNIWEGWKEESQERRARHRIAAPCILQEHDISFSEFNDAHLYVMGYFEDFDFWPGTGLYKGRKTGKKGRGIFNLIREIKGDK